MHFYLVKFLYIIEFVVKIVIAYNTRDLAEITITTGLGKIRGTYLTTRLGETFYAFRGIRYATPPIEKLRFKAPEPVELWHEIFDATIDGPICPQPSLDTSNMSEDCLRLNIYSRELPSKQKPNVRKPVIVYFHPGRFYSKSGSSKEMAGPEILMDQKIVLVTVNYRLGALGFLSTGTPDAPGNAGLKDQVMALKWIKIHITKFGGNPNSVTLMGYGAGAISVTLHLISPMSKHLFHKAIIMSGSSTGQWKLPQANQMNLTQKQAALLNCTDERIPSMIQCLRGKHYMEFIRTHPSMFEFRNRYPILLWKPVIEANLGKEMFVNQDPTTAFNDGHFNRVPIITGVTEFEFVTEAYDLLKNQQLREQFDEHFTKVAPVCFFYNSTLPKSRNVSLELRKMYLGSGSLHTERSLETLGAFFSDSLSGFSVNRLVQLASRRVRVYYYHFSYKGRFGHFYYPKHYPFGAVHYDDLMYLFNIPNVAPFFGDDDPERFMTEKMTRLWYNFAANGNPNKANDEYLKDLRWTPYNKRQENYLNIGDELVMKRNLYADRYAVWDRLFPVKK